MNSGVYAQTELGRKKEVGLKKMDSQAAKMLNVPSRKPSQKEQELLDHIQDCFDTTEVTPMNTKYGPISGMTEWERLIRAYDFGLLLPK